MKPDLALTGSAAALIVTVATAEADSSGFQGPYAPETWTVTGADIGGSTVLFADDGSELFITGSDGGFGSTISAAHSVVADGVWSFQWTWYAGQFTPGSDVSYYTINGTKFLISYIDGSVKSGAVSVPVTTGQVIGWQVVSADGIFGPGVLTISDFRVTVPAPAAVALLGFAAVIRRSFGGRIRR